MDYDQDGNTLDGLGAGASGEWDDGPDFVYDPISGMPIADPSHVLRDMGYERQSADAAQAVTQNVGQAVGSILNLGKYVVYGVVGIIALEALAEVNRIMPKQRRGR